MQFRSVFLAALVSFAAADSITSLGSLFSNLPASITSGATSVPTELKTVLPSSDYARLTSEAASAATSSSTDAADSVRTVGMGAAGVAGVLGLAFAL